MMNSPGAPILTSDWIANQHVMGIGALNLVVHGLFDVRADEAGKLAQQ